MKVTSKLPDWVRRHEGLGDYLRKQVDVLRKHQKAADACRSEQAAIYRQADAGVAAVEKALAAIQALYVLPNTPVATTCASEETKQARDALAHSLDSQSLNLFRHGYDLDDAQLVLHGLRHRLDEIRAWHTPPPPEKRNRKSRWQVCEFYISLDDALKRGGIGETRDRGTLINWVFLAAGVSLPSDRAIRARRAHHKATAPR